MKKIYSTLRLILLYSILILYIFILAKILLFKYVSPFDLSHSDRLFSRTLNIIPIKFTLEYFFSSISLKIALMNVAGNIIIFIPAGVYLQLFKKDKKIIKSVAIVFLISLCVEIAQYIFGIGTSDIDDVFLNTLGGLIGVFIYRIVDLLFKDERKTKTVIAVCPGATGVLSLILIIRCYPQMLGIHRHTESVIMGEEFAVDDKYPDVIGEFISFHDGIRNIG